MSKVNDRFDQINTDEKLTSYDTLYTTTTKPSNGTTINIPNMLNYKYITVAFNAGYNDTFTISTKVLEVYKDLSLSLNFMQSTSYFGSMSGKLRTTNLYIGMINVVGWSFSNITVYGVR